MHCHKTDTIVNEYLVRMCLVLMRAWLLEWTPRRCLVDSTRKRCEVVIKWVEIRIQQKNRRGASHLAPTFWRKKNQYARILFDFNQSKRSIRSFLFCACTAVQEQSTRLCVSCFWCTFLAKHSTSIMRSKAIAKRIRHQFGENYGVMCGRRFTRLWDEN